MRVSMRWIVGAIGGVVLLIAGVLIAALVSSELRERSAIEAGERGARRLQSKLATGMRWAEVRDALEADQSWTALYFAGVETDREGVATNSCVESLSARADRKLEGYVRGELIVFDDLYDERLAPIIADCTGLKLYFDTRHRASFEFSYDKNRRIAAITPVAIAPR